MLLQSVAVQHLASDDAADFAVIISVSRGYKSLVGAKGRSSLAKKDPPSRWDPAGQPVSRAPLETGRIQVLLGGLEGEQRP